MLRLGWQDRDKVYVALIAALHALRVASRLGTYGLRRAIMSGT